VTGFQFPDGTGMEVWCPEEEFHCFFPSGPVVGFLVDDVDDARARMETAGTEFLGRVQRSATASWNYFRGPDGNVYEIISHPRPLKARSSENLPQRYYGSLLYPAPGRVSIA